MPPASVATAGRWPKSSSAAPRAAAAATVVSVWAGAGPRHVRDPFGRPHIPLYYTIPLRAREPNPPTTPPIDEKGACHCQCRLRPARQSEKAAAGEQKRAGGIELASGGQPGIPFLPSFLPDDPDQTDYFFPPHPHCH